MVHRTLFAALFALLFATTAHAQVIGNVGVKATTPVLKTDVKATTSVVDDKSEAAVKADTDTEVSASKDGSDDGFVITRSDISAKDEALYDPADITTSAELSAYARSIMSADENIAKVEYNKEKVSIWYKEPGQFLGIIPVTVTTKATVSADGKIEIDRPWYSAFITAEEKTSLENSIGSTAGTIARGEAATELSSNAQARLLNALRASMKMHFESTATTSSSTDSRY